METIDVELLGSVIGGAERGPWERGLGAGGTAVGRMAGAPLGPVGSAVGGALVGGYGAQLGRAIDNPQPGPTGGVSGTQGPDPVSP